MANSMAKRKPSARTAGRIVGEGYNLGHKAWVWREGEGVSRLGPGRLGTRKIGHVSPWM